MKIIHLPAFAVTLIFAASAYAAINCGTLPYCESLGFTQTKAECPDKYQICPFDKNKVVCIDGPAVGDVKHSLKSSNHDGWLLCNGQAVSRTDYSLLYNVIGTKFGSGDGSKTFNVPDYRGYFLRAAGSNLSSYGGSANSETKTPQRQELPNITGTMTLDTHAGGSGKITGAFSVDTTQSGHWSGDDKGGARGVQFSAAGSSSVYQGAGNVIPANYALNVFIYAGK